MSSLEATLYTGLTGDAGLSALVSTRIYPVHLPQPAVFPAITYSRISTPREYTIGDSVVSATPRIQFDVWDDDYDGLIAVTAALLAAIRALASSGGVTVHTASVVNEIDDYDSETGVHRRIVEAVILHEGAI